MEQCGFYQHKSDIIKNVRRISFDSLAVKIGLEQYCECTKVPEKFSNRVD